MVLMTVLNVGSYLYKTHKATPHVVAPTIQQFSPLPPAKQEETPPPPQQALPEFVDVPIAAENVKEVSLYADIMNRTTRPCTNYDRDTNAHETTHFINSNLRNTRPGQNYNAFYVLNGKGVFIKEPNCKKDDAIEFLPKNLRSYRFSTYLSGQGAWNDQPLYIFDEWVAYINGGMVSVQDVQQGRYKGQWTDAVSGCLDFSIYSIAIAMAVEKHDPSYFENNKQFTNFLIWNLQRAYDTYKLGSKMKEFTWNKQDNLLKELLTSQEAAPMREFMKKHLKGVWLDAEVPAVKVKYGKETIRFHIVASRCFVTEK